MKRHSRFVRTRSIIVALASLGLVGLAAVGLVNEVARSDSPIPPEKQEYRDREDRLRAEALANPPPPGAEKPDDGPPLGMPKPRQNGIRKIWQAPTGYRGFTFTNMWEGDLGGGVVLVYAGGDPSRGEPAQGLVVVLVFTAKLQPLTGDWGVFRTPFNAGSLRIVAASGELLTLVADNGTKLLFEVASRRFLWPDTLAPLPPAATPTPQAPPFLAAAGSAGTVAIDTNVSSSPANSATSLGSIEACNTLSTAPLYTGTPTGGNTATTLNDTTQGFPAGDGLLGKAVRITAGAGAGQTRIITANTATQLTVNPAWAAVPDGTSAYEVLPTLYVDVTIDAVPAYDPGTDTGGLSGLGFNLMYDGDVVSVVGYDPGGDSDILLAAGGPRSPFDGVDADATGTLYIEPLPSTSGNMRLELADLSAYVESGAGVLVRLVFVGVGAGVSSLTLNDLLLLDAADEEYQALVEGGQVAVNSGCP